MIPLNGKLYEVTKEIQFLNSRYGVDMPHLSITPDTFIIPQGTILLCGRVNNTKYTAVVLKLCKKYNPDFKKKYPNLEVNFNCGGLSIELYNEYFDGNLRQLTPQEQKDAFNQVAR